MTTFTAVDLGATSGRIVNVTVDADTFALDVVRRFPTPSLVGADGSLVWDIDRVLDEVRLGLVEAVARSTCASMAIDSWGLDYGFVDESGRRVGPVHAYRSARTDGVMEDVGERVGRDRIYGITGIQFLPFNTIYQLVSARSTSDYRAASRLLMVPDLLNAALCGSTTNDVTNASTTQLLDVQRRSWSDELVEVLDLRADLLPPLHEPGAALGVVRGVAPEVDGLAVVAAASHDTASAVVGTPLRGDRPAVYISCGTWSLVGCEVARPVTTEEAMAANVTNELGADRRIRLLKNVTGLWLLEECRRAWAASGTERTAAALVADAEDVPGGRSVIDPDDARLAAPGDMPARIAERCRQTGQAIPTTPAEFTRTILDSLALKWRSTVGTIERVVGFDAEVVHLIGGGSSIPLLRRLCASACGRPVLAGPPEAAAAGNAIVQAMAAGVVESLDEGRRLIERDASIVRVPPERTIDWEALTNRLDPAGAR